METIQSRMEIRPAYRETGGNRKDRLASGQFAIKLSLGNDLHDCLQRNMDAPAERIFVLLQ